MSNRLDVVSLLLSARQDGIDTKSGDRLVSPTTDVTQLASLGQSRQANAVAEIGQLRFR